METMEAIWVIGRFTGDRAKSVKEHADAGSGYFIREAGGRGMNYEVTAAFRIANDRPLPEYLQMCTREQSLRLEEKMRQRQGFTNHLRKDEPAPVVSVLGQRKH